MSALSRPVGAEEFKRACAMFATGVTIAGVRDPAGTPHGLTVNSFTSVSLHPPLILICLGHAASVIEYFRSASHFGLSILDEHQKSISDHFARKGHDRFDRVAWRPGETGAPLLDGVLGEIECATVRRIPVGDHDLFIGEVVHTRVHTGRPLIYYGSKYRGLA